MPDLFRRRNKKAPAEEGPDFSGVDKEEALQRVAAGEMEPLLLLPAALGGEAIAENTVYVPTGLAAVYDELALRGVRALMDGGCEAVQYNAVPQYRGESFVPVAIAMKGWDDHTGGGFDLNFEIW